MRITYVVMLLAAGTALTFSRDFTSLICVVLIVILPVLTYVSALYTARNIQITFEPAHYLVASGNSVAIQLTLVNKTWFPISYMRLKLISQNSFGIANTADNIENVSLQILPFGTARLNVAVISAHCGNVYVEIKNVRIYDIFRLTYATSQLVNNTAEIINLPQILKSDELLAISNIDTMNSSVYSESKSGDDTSQVFDYHEYGQGDNLKSINWKLSSRMDTLMVKEFSFPIGSSILVMTELNAHTYHDIDSIISELYWVSHWLLENYYTHTIRWIDSESLSECNHVVDPAVDDETAFVSVLKQIYSVTVQQENNLLYGYSGSVSCANVIYIVRTVSEEMISKLCEIGLETNLTVICHYDQNNTNLLSLQQELEAHGVKLMIL